MSKKLFFFTWGLKAILVIFFFIAFVCLAAAHSNNALWIATPEKADIYGFKLSLECTEAWPKLRTHQEVKEPRTLQSFYCDDPVVVTFKTNVPDTPVIASAFSLAFVVLSFFALIAAILFTFWRRRLIQSHFFLWCWVIFLLLTFLSIVCSSVAAKQTKELVDTFNETLSPVHGLLENKSTSYFSTLRRTTKDGLPDFEIYLGSAYYCLITHAIFASLVVLVGMSITAIDATLHWMDSRKERETSKESEEVPLSLLVDVSRRESSGSPPCPSSNSFEIQSEGETMKLSVKEFDDSSKRSELVESAAQNSARSDVNEISTRSPATMAYRVDSEIKEE